MKTIRIFLALAFVGVALGTAATQADASPNAGPHAVFTVNTTKDSPDKNPGDGQCIGKKMMCSLRAAIMEANALPGKDVIELPAGTYKLKLGGIFEDAGKTGDLDISGALTLKGAGSDKTIIDGKQLDGVLDILKGKVVIKGVTIRNGKAVNDLPAHVAMGGGISVGRGNGDASLQLVKSVVTSNTTEASGGGILGYDAVTLKQSRIESNTASSLGGGINTNSKLTLKDSMVLYNSATQGAGGIMVNGTTSLLRSTVGFNTSHSVGGGIWVNRSPIEFTAVNSSISSNNAEGNGGGIFSQGKTELYNVTLDENNVNPGKVGAGIFISLDSVKVRNTLLSFNLINNTTISDCSGTLTSDDYNLLTDTAGCTITGTTTNNIYNPIANVLQLSDNGGPTWTNALANGSKAIDAGNPAGCKDNNGVLLTTDQRGSTRPTDGDGTGGAQCDIGAFEK